MPVPQPASGESQQDYLQRCLSDDAMVADFPEQEQRAAVCHSQFRDRFLRDGPSHQITQEAGKVTIRDLELFVGFDPAIDDADDARLKKYDRAKVREVIARTKQMGERGQSPKLILEHNPTNKDDPGSPVIGDIPTESLQLVEINGAPGIAGDVVMTAEDFENYIKSNRWPRRSAEIWPDGFLSEVALLSGRTPARPIPDTRFRKAEVFCRDLPVVQFAQPDPGFNEPGPTNVKPPAARKRTMPDDTDKDTMDHKDDDEIKKLRARNQELEDEVEKLKAQNSKMQKDLADKERFARGASSETDRWGREKEVFSERIESLEQKLVDQQFSNKFDQLEHSGYRVGSASQVKEHMDRILRAARDGTSVEDRLVKAEVEFQYIKTMLHRDPVGNRPIDQMFVQRDGASVDQMEKETKAAESARDRCTKEGSNDPLVFKQYYEENLKTA